MRARKTKFPFYSQRKPWSDNSNTIWLASTLHLYRNVAGYHFPEKLQPAQSDQVRDLLTAELMKVEQFSKSYSVPLRDLGPLEREYLFEHYLCPRGFQETVGGEGFIIDDGGELFTAINMRDHLHLQITDCKEELEQSWNRLMAVETRLGKSLSYAYSSRFGFLTADPAVCGTGLRVRLYMHVPALIQTGSLENTLESLGNEVIEATGIQGALDETPGDIVIIGNRCSLGLTDENILQSLRTYCLKLHVAEKALKGQIADQQAPVMKDRIARSFGLLFHSYQLETVEAWSGISLLKLGLDLGWVEGLSHETLNELFFLTRRAHLIAEYTQELTAEELPRRRAEYLHEALADACLTL